MLLPVIDYTDLQTSVCVAVAGSFSVVKFTDEQYTIHQGQDVSTRGSWSTAYKSLVSS